MDGASQQMADRPVFDSSPRRGGTASSKNIWVIVGVLGFIAVIVIGWIVVSRFRGQNEEAKSSPSPEVFAEFATPSPTPEKEIDKSKISIEVLNGTGIAKEASFLRDKLASLGYENIETGNADSKKYDVAKVTFYESFPESLKEELLDELKDIYTEVEDKDSSKESDVDVRVVTGLRPGVTRPTPTPEAEEEAEPTDEPEESPTPSPSISPSPSE